MVVGWPVRRRRVWRTGSARGARIPCGGRARGDGRSSGSLSGTSAFREGGTRIKLRGVVIQMRGRERDSVAKVVAARGLCSAQVWAMRVIQHTLKIRQRVRFIMSLSN
jgi:hypothetical protein